MPITNWNAGLSVGVEYLDADHRHLIEIMNDVFDAMMLGTDSSASRKGLQVLSTYVVDHFNREEEWMAARGFTDLVHHRHEHELLREQIAQLLKQSDQGADEVALELLVVLRDWLLRHIGVSDQSAAGRDGAANPQHRQRH
jgi:hemerythrin